MAKKTEETTDPVVEQLGIGDPSNQFEVVEPTAASKNFLSAVLPHVINAVQAAYAGTAKGAVDEHGKHYIERNGGEKLASATALIHILDNSSHRQLTDGISADYAIAEIEKTLTAMKNNGTLAK